MEAHRTTYGVESKLGEGSTFWFEMRVEAVAEKDAEDAVLPEDTPLETDYLPSHHSDT